MNNVLQGVLVLDTATSIKLRKEGKCLVNDNGLNVEVTLNRETGLCEFVQHKSTKPIILVPNDVTIMRVSREDYDKVTSHQEYISPSGKVLSDMQDVSLWCGMSEVEAPDIKLVVRR